MTTEPMSTTDNDWGIYVHNAESYYGDFHASVQDKTTMYYAYGGGGIDVSGTMKLVTHDTLILHDILRDGAGPTDEGGTYVKEY